MKKTFGQRLKAALTAFQLPTVVNPITPDSQILRTFGFNNVTVYPSGNDQTYIEKGYQKNAWVYSIVSKCAKKFSQVPWYHYKVKTAERKTWAEYAQLTKDLQIIYDSKARMEARKMRKKAVEQIIVTSDLQDLLNKPNRNQARAAFMENLYGFKLLTGEGNIWLPRLSDTDKPTELLIIPKSIIALVRGNSNWSIAEYRLLFSAMNLPQPPENVMRWIFPSYSNPDNLLSHLRGQSPLDAGRLLLQSSNEGAERLIAMNKNQGVAGAVYDKGKRDYPSPQQAQFIRSQFNDIINSPELAGQIGYLTGDLGYLQFGLDAGQLKLLEQSDVQFKGLCNIFDIPWQLFGNADSYENRKQYKRDFVYDNIAPAAYSLRDELNAKLIPAFNLDRDRDVIDCDILALPELSDDMKAQVEYLTKVWQLTPNQVLEQLGFDPSPEADMNKVYIPAGYSPLDQVNSDIGASLDNQLNMLNQ